MSCMSAIKLRQSMENFESALQRLEEALRMPLDATSRDAVILRFTFVYELAWKTLRRCLIYDKVESSQVGTPRDVMKKAYQAHWLEDDRLWLDMADDRNLLVHTYNENLAVAVYEHIESRHALEFRRVHTFLNDKFADVLNEA